MFRAQVRGVHAVKLHSYTDDISTCTCIYRSMRTITIMILNKLLASGSLGGLGVSRRCLQIVSSDLALIFDSCSQGTIFTSEVRTLLHCV